MICPQRTAREQCQWKTWSWAEKRAGWWEAASAEGCPRNTCWGCWLEPSLHPWALPTWENRLAKFVVLLWQTYSCIFGAVYSWHPKLLGKDLNFPFSAFDVPSPGEQSIFIPWIAFPILSLMAQGPNDCWLINPSCWARQVECFASYDHSEMPQMAQCHKPQVNVWVTLPVWTEH